MTGNQQRAALQSQIWKIANDVRGAVDGWDFKQYVLGTLFYRFISENFAAYMEGDDESINYAELGDEVITPEIKDDAIKTKGYFIYPGQLFANITASANTNNNLNTDLASIFAAIESSASGYTSEGDIKGLFADFVLHALSYLSSKGRAAIVSFPGIFYRGGAEQKIRQYLVDNNFIETVISLAPNLFFGTTIAVNILVLSKHKSNTTTQFIDASGLFKKATNNNILTDDHIEKIIQAFNSKANIEHFAKSVPFEDIATNDYNLSVSSYVEARDTREVIDITELNAEIKTTVAKIDRLRADIDAIVAGIEGVGV